MTFKSTCRKRKKLRIEIELREKARKAAEREEEARREVERSAQEATINEPATILLESSSGKNNNDSGAVEHLTSEVGVQTNLSLKDVKYIWRKGHVRKKLCVKMF